MAINLGPTWAGLTSKLLLVSLGFAVDIFYGRTFANFLVDTPRQMFVDVPRIHLHENSFSVFSDSAKCCSVAWETRFVICFWNALACVSLICVVFEISNFHFLFGRTCGCTISKNS